MTDDVGPLDAAARRQRERRWPLPRRSATLSTPTTEPHTPERAKQLAGLLRADLAAAGHAIPHALALEWETVDQTTVPMTVAELRAATEDLPATTEILPTYPLEPGPDATRHSIPAAGADVRLSLGAPGDHLTLYGELGSGRHRRARRLVVTVSGLPHDKQDGPPGAEALTAAVSDAVAGLGQRGVRIRNFPDEGRIRWTWQSASVPLDRIAATARRAIAELDPGTWEVSDNLP